jgi:hypothetical protein
VGIVTLNWSWYAFVPAGIYLLIHIAEGETVTPMVIASSNSKPASRILTPPTASRPSPQGYRK